MLQITKVALFALAATVAFTAARSAADEAKAEYKRVGTWKLVAAKYGGQEVTVREGSTKIKHVTPTQFMWADYDAEGNVGAALGGSYTLQRGHVRRDA